MVKYVVITGGVVSGLGKGITTSSIGVLLQASGLRVTSIKIDPYLNIDAGTMSPYEHGEVFVLDDGGVCDLDLGNYERFLDVTLTRNHNITTGRVYNQVIEKERRGDYLGKTVQIIPHVTKAITDHIEQTATISVDASGNPPDICLIELGGVVGDIESAVFLEALRQLRYKVGSENFCLVHVSLVPIIGVVGEQKTKPTQNSVSVLRALGLNPDIVCCRCSMQLERSVMEKISMFCMVPFNNVICIKDVGNVYEVPSLLLEQRVHGIIFGCLKINKMPAAQLPFWEKMLLRIKHSEKEVRIAIVGKYTGLKDSYLSVIKALHHAAVHEKLRLVEVWIESSDLEVDEYATDKEASDRAWNLLKSVDGILIPGGFGDRGVEGKIMAAKYARENNIPYFGICLGFQVAVIEYCRHVMGLGDAMSEEFNDQTPHPVIMYMPEIQRGQMGVMRLGSRVSFIKKGTLAAQIYSNQEKINERHRHRYEVNPKYAADIEKSGLVISAKDDSGERVEMIENPKCRFFYGCQFHPEFRSRPMRPSPPFLGFIRASAQIKLPAASPRSRSPAPEDDMSGPSSSPTGSPAAGSPATSH